MLLMGKSTISMAVFNSFLYVYQRVYPKPTQSYDNQNPNKSSMTKIPIDFLPYYYSIMI